MDNTQINNSNSPEELPSQKLPRTEQRFVTVRLNLPTRVSGITYFILGITIFIYILQQVSQTLSSTGIDYPALLGMKINELILAGQLWRLLTPMLLHASIPHIFFNMYALYSFGSALERYYGHQRFLFLYLLSAFSGNVCSFIFSEKSSLGASTAIFGLVAAEAVFIYKNRLLFGNKAKSMLINTLMIVIINLILGLSPRIDNWGHLGGLLGGLIFAWFAGPMLKMEGQPSDLVMKDQQSVNRIWKIAIIELLFFSFMAALKILIN